MARHVKFLAFAVDGKIVASHLHWDWDDKTREDYKENVKKIFESPQWNAIVQDKKNRLELKTQGNVYCLELELGSPLRVFVSVVTSAYPMQFIFSSNHANSSTPRLMKDFRSLSALASKTPSISITDTKALRKAIEPQLKGIAAKFDDIESIDKLAAAAKRVADVQKIMADNINIASERDSLISGLNEKSGKLSESAKAMFTASQKVKRKSCMRLWWCYFLAAMLILIIAAAIVLGLNYGVFHWWE